MSVFHIVPPPPHAITTLQSDHFAFNFAFNFADAQSYTEPHFVSHSIPDALSYLISNN